MIVKLLHNFFRRVYWEMGLYKDDPVFNEAIQTAYDRALADVEADPQETQHSPIPEEFLN